MTRRWWVALLLLLPLAAAAQRDTNPAHDAPLLADASPLPTSIGGRTYRLQALILRPAGNARLPVALITHGAAPGQQRRVSMDALSGWGHDLAQRGYLAVMVLRRGYGTSDGEAVDDGARCESPDVGAYLDRQADDLRAALDVVAQRPDADMSRIVLIGHSVGAAAMLTLASRNTPPVSAVINVAGGVGPRSITPFHADPACTSITSDMVWSFARAGSSARMPTLWMYAENDALFRPGLVARMRAAYQNAGGVVELVELPPALPEGHAAFETREGREMLLPELDRFLRAHSLPTWDERSLAAVAAQLSPGEARTADYYFRMLPAEKALAVTEAGSVVWAGNARSLVDARTQVLDFCRKQSGKECRLLAVDFQPVPR